MNASIIGRRINVKKLGVAALLAVGMSAVSVQGIAALPSHEVYTTYYKDASKTTVVGEKIFTCGGRLIKFGKTSPYYDVFDVPCN